MALESILPSILGPIAENVMEPIGRELDYLVSYKSNIEDLKSQSKKLSTITHGVKQRVDADRRNLHSIALHVEDWLAQVEKINSEVESILEGKRAAEEGCLKGWCPNLKARYSFSKRAKKKTEEIVKLQNEVKDYPTFSSPAPPGELEPAAFEGVAEFESRKDVEERLIAALKDVDVHMVGLCGMGGVGKTTIAKCISKRVKDEKVFEEVVMAVVSHNPDPRKIQGEIAEALGLTLEEESLSIRADKLRTRLMNERKILVVLDDVWSSLDLNQLGIPSLTLHKGCKILLTSRHRDVCNFMGAENIITLEILSEAEAWNLFKEKAGNSAENPQLFHVAKDVAKECKGLPIALVTVGLSLKDKSKPFWEDARVQLRRAQPANLPGVVKDVYRPLELSYNNLESEEAKFLFLMCCLFPEDAYIPVDILVRYGMGLDIFSGVENVREARNRVHGLVETLKNRFLLVNNDDEIHVQMHDVIRDVAVSIASKDKHVFLVSHDLSSKQWPRRSSYENFTCISVISGAFDELPERLHCPKLEFLRLECNQQPLNAADNFFDEMRGLKVLEIRDFHIPSVPSSLRLLTNLRTLQLDCCEFLDKMTGVEEDRAENVLSMIAELVNLEILSFCYSNIKVLSAALGNLRNLRVLDVTECTELNIIEAGIKRLTKLEELHMESSFANWGTKIEGREGHNVSLTELESLANLTTLALVIPEANLIPKNLILSPMLAKYEVLVGLPNATAKEIPNDVRRHLKKIMCFDLPSPHSFGGSFHDMLRNTEYLYSRGDGSSSPIEALALEGFQHLKQLHLDDCSSVEHLANTIGKVPTHAGVFPVLEKISLGAISSLRALCQGQLPGGSFAKLKTLDFRKLPKLMHLWKGPMRGPTQDMFPANLVSVYIDECHILQSLFSLSIAQSLVQLEQLRVKKCKMMEEVISDEGAESENDISISEVKFPKLRFLGLDTLGNFTGFCKLIDGIQFPQLSKLDINSLPKLKNFSCKENGSTSGENQETDAQSLFDVKVAFFCLKMLKLRELAATNLWSRKFTTGSFSELEELRLVSCHGLKNLISSSMAKGLENLKELEIRDCSVMEEIIEKDEEEEHREEMSKVSLFPQLEILKLVALQELKRFCHMKHELELTLLEHVEINSCPKLSTFNLGSLSTPNLKVFKVDDREIEIKDLNSVIQQEFEAKQEEIQSSQNYYMLPALDLTSKHLGDDRWAFHKMEESSDESFVVIEAQKVRSLDIRGRFETVNLSSRISYEVVFVIMLKEPTKGWEEPVSLQLILPNGSITDRTENLKSKPRGRWIEILVGEFKRSPDEIGDIEFALVQQKHQCCKERSSRKGCYHKTKSLKH